MFKLWCERGIRNSQLSLRCDELGEVLQYTENIRKTNNGGLSHLRIKRKVVRAYKNLTNVERCPVELYKKNTCLTGQMKLVTTNFICALCQSQMGKYGTTKRQGEKL